MDDAIRHGAHEIDEARAAGLEEISTTGSPRSESFVATNE
jgi:hypothetical protein